jgi:hypothetical protein
LFQLQFIVTFSLLVFCSEALEAGGRLLALEAAKRELEAEGVPVIVSTELARRVLGADSAASIELVVRS